MIKNLKAKLAEETTPIVAYGLICLAVILVYLMLARASDSVRQLSGQIEAAEQELALLKSLEQQDVWTERLSQANMFRESVYKRLWRGETPGIVSAELQEVIRTAADTLSLGSVQINVDASPEEIGGVLILNFNARGRFLNPEASLRFLGNLSDSSRDIITKDATIRISSSDTSDVNFSGFIPILISEAETDA